MKTKSKVILAILILALSNLACGSAQSSPTQVQNLPIAPEENFATREMDIESDNQQYLTPENWNTTPSACSKSLLKLWLYPEDQVSIGTGSASLITTDLYKDISGNNIFVYHVSTADHVVKDDNQKITGSKIVVFPYNYQDQNLVFGYIGYTQIFDPNNTPLDLGVYSFFSLGSDPLVSLLTPAGIQSLVSGNYLTPGTTDFYFGFGYPYNLQNPQYVISTVHKSETNSVYLRPLEKFSNVTGGNSGGPICNQNNQIVGVTSMIDLQNPELYRITPLPSNIVEQFNIAVQNTNKILAANNITKAP